MQEMKRTFEAYHNTEDGRIKMDVSIHAEYTSNPLAVREVSLIRKKSGSQNAHPRFGDRVRACGMQTQIFGMTPLQYFDSLRCTGYPGYGCSLRVD